ncbi:sugar transferase [Massilimicrobiota timonensis]|uniref:Sugar transferase n=1 Tax=Massilimicrobiota timonensis TaxID=1776392 RepID=A0ABT7UIG2_9FIRM|nr:sugar transferase [Massilimicrobiota timonensis]MDM8195722.1 sugar transferase [Massilimicrobiota timonensis]
MLLRKWDDIPEFMRNDEVKKYYDILIKKRFSLMLKRFFDIIMSLLLLIVLSPVFLILAIWIKADSKGTVFYRQERITQYGRTFRIFKFRTMVSNADKIGTLVTTQNDSRITRVGEKIRKCRLDETPQLINILKGDMSFVGTRPEVQKYVDAYTDEMKATLLLPAGVTSLASLKYRDEDEIISQETDRGKTVDQAYIENVLPEKMKFNLEYLNNFNILKDVNLCVKTVI